MQDVNLDDWVSTSREGVITEWPLNEQFHDARDIILTSRTDIREMFDDNDKDKWPSNPNPRLLQSDKIYFHQQQQISLEQSAWRH